MKRLAGSVPLLVALLSLAPAVRAGLVLQGVMPISGAGIGNELTILTIQNNGATETGCVSFNNLLGGTMTAGGGCTGSRADVKTGSSQTGTATLSSIGTGTVDASTFSVIFNANQPAGGGITLTALTVAIYSPTGTLLFQSEAASCTAVGLAGCGFQTTVNGIGGADYQFKLDAEQGAAATAAGAFANMNNIVGLTASASSAAGGPETFFLVQTGPTATAARAFVGSTASASSAAGGPETLFLDQTSPTASVVEPSSMLLLGAGLIGLAATRLKRT